MADKLANEAARAEGPIIKNLLTAKEEISELWEVKKVSILTEIQSKSTNQAIRLYKSLKPK
jgi:hypothetical protein